MIAVSVNIVIHVALKKEKKLKGIVHMVGLVGGGVGQHVMASIHFRKMDLLVYWLLFFSHNHYLKSKSQITQ